MISYRLKLLTILANFLITHLLIFDEGKTTEFVMKLIDFLDNILH
jgi:hypothetical protein